MIPNPLFCIDCSKFVGNTHKTFLEKNETIQEHKTFFEATKNVRFFLSLNPEILLQYYTMVLQRIRIIMRDDGFEVSNTGRPEVWFYTNEPPHFERLQIISSQPRK